MSLQTCPEEKAGYNVLMKKPIDIKFTKEGYEKLGQEYQQLTEKRPGVLSRMVAAREQGDLSENAGYHASKEELGKIDSRLRELKLLMRFGEIVDSSGTGLVGVSSIVKVSAQGKTFEFNIVGQLEADPVHGKLSEVSPIGSALLGKKVGDKVEVEIPDGKTEYIVIEIK